MTFLFFINQVGKFRLVGFVSNLIAQRSGLLELVLLWTPLSAEHASAMGSSLHRYGHRSASWCFLGSTHYKYLLAIVNTTLLEIDFDRNVTTDYGV